MKKLTKDCEVQDLIKDNPMAVIYFTGNDCGACEAIKFKIDNILKRFPKIKSGEIQGEENPDIAAKYEVFSLPIFLLYIDGKETLRLGRHVNLLELEENIERYYNLLFK